VLLQVPCGNQFELLGRQVYLAVSNKCPQDMAGKPRKVRQLGSAEWHASTV
jgi:hypothetical protein